MQDRLKLDQKVRERARVQESNKEIKNELDSQIESINDKIKKYSHLETQYNQKKSIIQELKHKIKQQQEEHEKALSEMHARIAHHHKQFADSVEAKEKELQQQISANSTPFKLENAGLDNQLNYQNLVF